jgi:NADPH:quinone reductase-like Zn-dependent oxidoreductase
MGRTRTSSASTAAWVCCIWGTLTGPAVTAPRPGGDLCGNAWFTGYDLDGGFAEYAAAYARYCFRLPEGYGDTEVAQLLCAGLIGYRTYRLAGMDD